MHDSRFIDFRVLGVMRLSAPSRGVASSVVRSKLLHGPAPATASWGHEDSHSLIDADRAGLVLLRKGMEKSCSTQMACLSPRWAVAGSIRLARVTWTRVSLSPRTGQSPEEMLGQVVGLESACLVEEVAGMVEETEVSTL